MIIDYIHKTVTLTFDEMKAVQTDLNEAMRYSRMEPKDANPSTVRYWQSGKTTCGAFGFGEKRFSRCRVCGMLKNVRLLSDRQAYLEDHPFNP